MDEEDPDLVRARSLAAYASVAVAGQRAMFGKISAGRADQRLLAPGVCAAPPRNGENLRDLGRIL